ncbi:hypothetical protein ACFW9O_21290 [Streptomyces sp. NPDC059499]|uniref:hypothetical protein n=1 Tax=Streptomyces sp. NPDC059499 TaxID=3346852 RepID=UPI0036B5C962
MTHGPRRHPLDGLTDRRNWLIIVIVVVAAAPWIGEQTAAAALGLLAAALPATTRTRGGRTA